MTIAPFEVLVVQRARSDHFDKLLGRARVRVGSVVLELELIEGRQGVFVTGPSRRADPGETGDWIDRAVVEDSALWKAIIAAVREQFEKLPKESPRVTAEESGSDDLPF